MKKLIPIIAVIALFVMSSCGQINSDNKEKPKTEETTTPQDGGKGQTGTERDSSSSATGSSNKIKILEDSIKSLNDSIKEIGEKVDDNQKAIQEVKDNCYFCQYGIIAYVAYAIAIIILFLIVNFIVLKLTEKSPEAKKKEKDKNPMVRIKQLEMQLAKMQNGYYLLSSKLDELRNDVASISNNLIYQSARIPEQSPNRANPAVRQPVVKPAAPQQNKRQTEFYLRFPGMDGSFEDNRVAKSEGYYLFELYQHNPETARFTFKPGDATLMTKAINNRAAYIEKACSPVNAFEAATMSRCKPDGNDFGEARLENGKWKVIKKQNVRYE